MCFLLFNLWTVHLIIEYNLNLQITNSNTTNFIPIVLKFILLEFVLVETVETENEWQKTEPVPIQLPRASMNFPDVKSRNVIFFYNSISVPPPKYF